MRTYTYARFRVAITTISLSVALSLLPAPCSGQNPFSLSERKLDPAYPGLQPVCDCAALLKTVIANTVIESAEINKSDSSCRVVAVVTHPPFNDRVKITTALPMKNWNGRYWGTGGGGFSGGSLISVNEPVLLGYAAGSTDAGHEGGSGAFALDTVNHRLRWQEIRDFAYLGIHDMTVVGKTLVEAFYGKPARYAYFTGGSNGGRQALTEAQRYPEDYNGILALCPAIYWSTLLVTDLWPQAVMNDSKNYISNEKLQAVKREVISACDALDGTEDGVIEDPLNCTWDPQDFTGTEVEGKIFTAEDADVVRRIWEGPRGNDGSSLWYGLTRGTNMLPLAATSITSGKGLPFSISAEWVKYFLLLDPGWDGSTLTCAEFESLFNQSVDQFSDVFEASNPELAPYRDRGGKLLILHGLADQLVPPQGTIKYFDQVRDRMGGNNKTSEFARLFLIPGVDHGFMGFGARPSGYFDALVNWVEEGKAPEYMNTIKNNKPGEMVRPY